MKIQAANASQIYKSYSALKKHSDSSASVSSAHSENVDRIEISKDVAIFNEARAIAINMAKESALPASAERINELKAMVSNGSYSVSADALALSVLNGFHSVTEG